MNHYEAAKEHPEIYCANVPNYLGIEEPVAKIATDLGLSEILARYGIWAVTKDGVHSLHLEYHIPTDRLHEDFWLDSLQYKVWVHYPDFEKAFNEARKLLLA